MAQRAWFGGKRDNAWALGRNGAAANGGGSLRVLGHRLATNDMAAAHLTTNDGGVAAGA